VLICVGWRRGHADAEDDGEDGKDAAASVLGGFGYLGH